MARRHGNISRRGGDGRAAPAADQPPVDPRKPPPDPRPGSRSTGGRKDHELPGEGDRAGNAAPPKPR